MTIGRTLTLTVAAALVTCVATPALAQTYTAIELGSLGGSGSEAFGINASGQVVGDAYTPRDAAFHAFVTGMNGVGMTDLGTLGGSNSIAYAINAGGQVVGYSNITPEVYHAFITGANSTRMTDLGTLGGTYSLAWGINASGQVVGYASLPSNVGLHHCCQRRRHD